MAEPVFDRLGAEGLLIELSSLVTVIRNATEKAGPLAEDMTDGALFPRVPRARAAEAPRRHGAGAEQARRQTRDLTRRPVRTARAGSLPLSMRFPISFLGKQNRREGLLSA